MRLTVGLALGVLAVVGASGCRFAATPEQLFAEAEALRARHDAAATQAAIAKYRLAHAAWRGIDKRAAARAATGVGDAFEQIGLLRESLQAYQDALVLAVESGDLEIRSELHSAIGINKAYAADRSELLDQAEGECRSGLDIARRIGGLRQEARGLNCLAEVMYARGGNLEPALENYSQAERLWTQLDDPHGLALAVLAQGWVYSDMRRFDEARRSFEDAKSRWTSLGENRHLAITLVSEARLLQRRGYYQEALNAFEKASALLRPIGDAIWQGSSLTGQALIRFNMADVTQALTLHERALGLFEASGLKNFSIDALMSLGSALLASGDESGALQRFERALTLASELGNARYQTWAHRNIGSVRLSRGETALAQQHLRRSVEILLPLGERRLHALVLADLGEVEQLLGNHDTALRYFDEALAVSRSAEDREQAARGLFARGALEAQQGRFGPARASLNEALAERSRLFGSGHPLVAETRAALARVDFAGGSLGTALDGALAAEGTSRIHLRQTLRYLPERQGLAFATKRPRGLDLAISIAASGQRGFAARVLDELIQSRGLVLDELAARHRSIAGADPQVAQLAANVAQARQRFANLLVRSLEDSIAQSMLDEARQQTEVAERALAERSADARAEMQRSTIGLDAVHRALPTGSVLVSFVQYARSRGPQTGTASPQAQPIPSFAAFVVRAGRGSVVMLSLGPAADTEKLIAEWREELAGRSLLAGGSPAEANRVLREKGIRLRQAIWDPVADFVQGASRLFIVPDGALSLVPFAALPIGESGFLLEQAPIHYLTAERDVASSPIRPQGRARGLLALGGAAFDAVGVPAAGAGAVTKTPVVSSNLRVATTACGDFQSLRFQPLDGTLAEVQELSSVWNAAVTAGTEAAQVLVDRQASESAFKRDAHRYRVLHLATHGFFLGGGCTIARTATRGVGALSGPTTRVENPLLLSGLALAGANRRASTSPDEDDGILTAEEVASLNLEGIEWAVLSACDTGVGEIKAGEGVFGLRRAFQVAGARTVLMSLWSVDDQATRAWMRALYEGRFKKNLGTSDAVHAASLAVLRERRAGSQSTHPFYWAAFVAVGDWR